MAQSTEIDLRKSDILKMIKDIDSGWELNVPVHILIPMYSSGVTSDHLDLCEDYLDASYAAERLGSSAEVAEIEVEFLEGVPNMQFRLSLKNPTQDFMSALRGVLIQYGSDFGVDEEYPGEVQTQRDAVIAYEETLSGDGHTPLFPMLIDSYYANRVGGVYWTYEGNCWVEDELKRFPERRFGFHKSALISTRVGAPCYASMESWLVPHGSLDSYFAAAGMPFSKADFIEGEILMAGQKTVAMSETAFY